MKQIDQHIALPSLEEIEQYQNGMLSNERAYEIEALAQENPLVADALEGFAALPAFTSLPNFEDGIPTSSSASYGIKLLVKTPSPWWHLNGWIIGIMVGSTSAMLLSTLYNIPASANANSDGMKIETKQFEQSQVNEEQAFDVIKTAEVQKAEKLIDKNNSTQSKTNILSDVNTPIVMDVNPIEEQRGNFVGLSGITPDPQVLVNDSKIIEGIKSSRLAAVQIAHIYDYKVADYSELRAGGWKPIEQIQTGTLANQENRDSKSSELNESTDTKAIPYMEYLAQCMNEFDRGRYAAAYVNFSLILKQYPTDVNAQFYGSMSMFKDGKYQEALEGFDMVLKNMISVFNEESRFYKAKSLKALGRLDEAKLLFEKIIRDNGFYANEASREI